ncbi:Hydrolase TatD [Balamuthia mandrillaris]
MATTTTSNEQKQPQQGEEAAAASEGLGGSAAVVGIAANAVGYADGEEWAKKRNKMRGKGTPRQLQVLRDRIEAQADKVRRMKGEEGEGEKWRKKRVMDAIFDLMELKYQYCCLSPVPVTTPELVVETEPPHLIRVRWRVRDKDGKITRLQRPFHDVTSITGRELAEVIRKDTHQQKRFPELSGFVKIERYVPADQSETQKPYYVALSPEDKLALPLRFPGPVLQKQWTVDLRVTFVERPSHLSTPSAYLSDGCTALPELIDAGVNLFDATFRGIEDKVVERAFGAGVSQLVLISTTPENSAHSLSLCEGRRNSLFATVGVHPNEAAKIPFTEIETLRKLVTSSYVVAIGECGLDEQAGEQGLQEQWLEHQIQLAIEAKKPIFLHERGQFERFRAILGKHAEALRDRAVVNCFTGSEEALQAYLDMGFYIGVTGFICNEARGAELQKVVAGIPLDRLLLGSDAPYLTPFTMPKPYPKYNEPAYLPHVLVAVASALNLSIDEVTKATTSNARKLFGMPVLPYDGTLRSQPFSTPFSPNAEMAYCRLGKEKAVADRPLDAATQASTSPSSSSSSSSSPSSSSSSSSFATTSPSSATSSETTFLYKDKLYRCTAKENAILQRQRNALSEEAFAALFEDFALCVIDS